MNRYYAWFQAGGNTQIANSFSRWKKQFSSLKQYTGFFDLESFDGFQDSKNIIKRIIAEIESPNNIKEIVILPLCHEPPDLDKALSILASVGIDLNKHISGEAIQNIYIFPIIKARDTILDMDDRIPLPKSKPSCFLFQGNRLTLEGYGDADWLFDIENFIYLTAEIERGGLDLFLFFPKAEESEIATFASRTFCAKKFIEVRDDVRRSLKAWIECQIMEDQDCRPCLQTIQSVVGAIREIGRRVADVDVKREAAMLEYGNCKYYSALTFSLIRDHLDELEEIDLLEKLQETARAKEPLLEDVMLAEYEEKVLDIQRVSQESKSSFLGAGRECLERKQTTVNCLLKEIEQDIAHEQEILESLNKRFAPWVKEKVDEAGCVSRLRHLLEQMKIYKRGVPLKILGSIYALGYAVVVWIQSKMVDLGLVDSSWKWRLISSLFIAALFPLLYNKYWHDRRRKEIEGSIKVFRGALRGAIASSARAYVQNAIYFYVGRYIRREEISLKRELLDLKQYLMLVKNAMIHYKDADLNIAASVPPMEISNDLNQIQWEAVFRNLQEWDGISVRNHFDNEIGEATDRLLRKWEPETRFPIERGFATELRRNMTFKVDEEGTITRLLLPEAADIGTIGGIDPGWTIRYPTDNKAIGLAIGKRGIAGR